jgi:hypothetical protein
MATISGCRQLKVNLKAKIYIYVNNTNLELRISPRIFEKIRNSPNVIIRGLGETDSRKKNRSKKSRDSVPLSKGKDIKIIIGFLPHPHFN